MAEAHEALAQVAALNKNYTDAIDDYKTAIGEAAHQDSATYARLSKRMSKISNMTTRSPPQIRCWAMTDAPAPVKQYAQAQKDIATKLKAK